MRASLVALALLFVACDPLLGQTAALGGGSNDLTRVDLRAVASDADHLASPRDVALHPSRDELWIVNNADNSMVIITAPDSAEQVATRYKSMGSDHFLAKPSALSFNPRTGFFATAHEEDQPTQGQGGTPGNFMGPTLWTSDMSIFDAGHGGHMDMLHNSPNAVGIAWEVDNRYWVVDGYHTALTRYDFNHDHGPGGADHSDGEILRYAEGEIGYLPGVSSHAVYDHERDLLYVADAANGVVVALDTTTGTIGGPVRPNYDGLETMREVEGAHLWTLIDASATAGAPALERPSGVALHGELLFVTDNQTGVIYAFTRDGDLVDWLDTELGAGLQGVRVDDDGAVWMVHTDTERIYRLASAR